MIVQSILPMFYANVFCLCKVASCQISVLDACASYCELTLLVCSPMRREDQITSGYMVQSHQLMIASVTCVWQGTSDLIKFWIRKCRALFLFDFCDPRVLFRNLMLKDDRQRFLQKVSKSSFEQFITTQTRVGSTNGWIISQNAEILKFYFSPIFGICDVIKWLRLRGCALSLVLQCVYTVNSR